MNFEKIILCVLVAALLINVAAAESSSSSYSSSLENNENEDEEEEARLDAACEWSRKDVYECVRRHAHDINEDGKLDAREKIGRAHV